MTKHKVTPEKENIINILKALEYISMGWSPYRGNDERMIHPERENLRKGFNNGKLIDSKNQYTSGQLDYNKNIYRAISVIENLLRNKKVEPSWFDNMYIYNADGYGVDKTSTDYSTIKEASSYGFESATIDFNGVTSIKLSNIHGHIVYINPHLKLEDIQQYEIDDHLNISTVNIIDDSKYTTPEIQLIKALIIDPSFIPLLYKRGEKNIDKLEKTIKQYNDKLGLNLILTKNKIQGILSVIKSPEAKKTGAIPTNNYVSTRNN